MVANGIEQRLLSKADMSLFLIYNSSFMEVCGNVGKIYDFQRDSRQGFDTAQVNTPVRVTIQ